MSDEKTLSEQEWHRKCAVENFNHVWELIDKADRSESDIDDMINGAHASRFHWGKVGGPDNWAIGEWQISRVYAVLRRPEAAIFHGRRSLAICKEHGLGDFVLAYAYEALARAYSLTGDAGQCRANIDLAQQAGAQIKEDDDKKLLAADLATVVVP